MGIIHKTLGKKVGSFKVTLWKDLIVFRDSHLTPEEGIELAFYREEVFNKIREIISENQGVRNIKTSINTIKQTLQLKLKDTLIEIPSIGSNTFLRASYFSKKNPKRKKHSALS